MREGQGAAREGLVEVMKKFKGGEGCGEMGGKYWENGA
jgi:hypothetical protein